MDYKKLAIADVLEHPEIGAVSFQPNGTDAISNEIKVLNCKGAAFIVLASECSRAKKKEVYRYWKEFDPSYYKTEKSMDGWRCPICGRGNSPFSTSCPCVFYYQGPICKITTET